jgi:hypothetical protein
MNEKTRSITSRRTGTASDGCNPNERKGVISTSHERKAARVHHKHSVICLTERAWSNEAVPYATPTDGLCCVWTYARYRR